MTTHSPWFHYSKYLVIYILALIYSTWLYTGRTLSQLELDTGAALITNLIFSCQILAPKERKATSTCCLFTLTPLTFISIPILTGLDWARTQPSQLPESTGLYTLIFLAFFPFIRWTSANSTTSFRSIEQGHRSSRMS